MVRLKRKVYRDALRNLCTDLHVNGNVAVIMDGHTYLGRTASINPEWWQNADGTLSVRKAWHAVDKALAGERLGAAQRRTVELMLDQITDERCADAQWLREKYQRIRELKQKLAKIRRHKRILSAA